MSMKKMLKSITLTKNEPFIQEMGKFWQYDYTIELGITKAKFSVLVDSSHPKNKRNDEAKRLLVELLEGFLEKAKEL